MVGPVAMWCSLLGWERLKIIALLFCVDTGASELFYHIVM